MEILSDDNALIAKMAGRPLVMICYRRDRHDATRAVWFNVHASTLLVVSIGLLGCSDESATYPVAGTVKLASGEPLPGGLIVFHPVGDVRHPARGGIAEDGTFQLSTYKPNDGAVPGIHKVLILPAVPDAILDDPAAVARYRAAVDSRYQSVQTTPLELDVKSDGSTNRFDIVVEPAHTRIQAGKNNRIRKKI